MTSKFDDFTETNLKISSYLSFSFWENQNVFDDNYVNEKNVYVLKIFITLVFYTSSVTISYTTHDLI